VSLPPFPGHLRFIVELPLPFTLVVLSLPHTIILFMELPHPPTMVIASVPPMIIMVANHRHMGTMVPILIKSALRLIGETSAPMVLLDVGIMEVSLSPFPLPRDATPPPLLVSLQPIAA
jgi:hypothetical protein